MSQYLLNIAARSTGNGSTELLPSKAVFNGAGTIASREFTEDNNTQDNGSFVQQNVFPAQPVMPQKVQQAIVLNATETGMAQKNIETSYFSKHTERAAAEWENSPVKNRASESVKFNIDDETLQGTVKNTGATQNFIAPLLIKQSVSKNLFEKKATKNPAEISLNETANTDDIIYSEKQNIQPSDKTAKIQSKKINLSENLQPERITPNQREKMHKRPLQKSKTNETAPKLIIGKIIVEILPPKLPVTQKVINRVVQSPSQNNHSKSNKLIFGLGQL